ncbi:Sec-independent protein translocase protein TatB [Limoniibacter endophyticus]|uniref:Sec-independent protein translocase protein TatB n=1 Tax=Limoniibacter endophyticus TaxID=1565040 RepID=A0A8J3DM82_9HYPH|nr:Sec-independent protein translocase protein TatB [Limoniibacter endophyticus]GHC62820.1 sec-independent protein translocase protein TatB [Limoniibacter endophyticus]
MFDIGWSEMLVIGILLIVVVGPKDLPRVLRAFGQATKKMRGMAGEFQRQFNQAMDEAELSELRKDVNELRSLNPKSQIQKHLNPLREAADDLKKTMDEPGKTAVPSEPLKGGREGDALEDPLIKAAEQNAVSTAPVVATTAASAGTAKSMEPVSADVALTPDPAAPKPKAARKTPVEAAPKAKATAPKKAAATKATKPRATKKKPASKTDESQ